MVAGLPPGGVMGGDLLSEGMMEAELLTEEVMVADPIKQVSIDVLDVDTHFQQQKEIIQLMEDMHNGIEETMDESERLTSLKDVVLDGVTDKTITVKSIISENLETLDHECNEKVGCSAIIPAENITNSTGTEQHYRWKKDVSLLPGDWTQTASLHSMIQAGGVHESRYGQAGKCRKRLHQQNWPFSIM